MDNRHVLALDFSRYESALPMFGNERKLVVLSLWTNFISACGQISSQPQYHRPSAFYSRGSGPAKQVTLLGPTMIKILLNIPVT